MCRDAIFPSPTALGHSLTLKRPQSHEFSDATVKVVYIDYTQGDAQTDPHVYYMN